jgi:predicted amidohydrolase
MTSVRIAAAQTPEYREDIDAALASMVDCAERADVAAARLLVFPEGFLQGYLTEETAARRVALQLQSPQLKLVAQRLAPARPMIVVGLIEVENGRLFNTAVVLQHGTIVGRYRKHHLLAGEAIFEAGTETPLFEVDGLRFGINICYDMNFAEAAQAVARQGAELLVCPANNMMRRASAEAFRTVHNAVRGERCRETGLWLISADVTGERDGRIAWGPTAVLDPSGRVVRQLPLEAPGLLLFDLPLAGTSSAEWVLPARPIGRRLAVHNFCRVD